MSYCANPNQKATSATGIYSLTAGSITNSAIYNSTMAATSIATTLNAASATINTLKAKGAYPTQTVAPPNWCTIPVRGSPYSDLNDVHEAPVMGKPAYIASLSIANPNGMHHWKLFRRLYPEIEYLFCGIAEIEDSRQSAISNVMFFDEWSFAIFETWFADYCDTFGGKENLYSYRLPPPPRVMGYSVQVMMGKHDDLAELSEWIMSNCSAKVYALGEMMFFLNDEDATLYKLRFSGT